MAVPLIPVTKVLIKSWPAIVAFTGLILATGFSFAYMLRQAGETALNLWPLVAIACFFFLTKEVVRAWYKIKKKEIESGRR